MSQGQLKPEPVGIQAKSETPRNNKGAIAAALLILTMLVVYYPTTREYYAVWSGILTYLHGFIVGPLAFGFVVLAARRLEFDWRRQSPILVIATASAGLAWIVAYLSATQVVQQLALIAMLYFGLAGLFGRKGLRTFLLPVSILVMATPVWDVLIEPLVNITTTVNTWLLTSLGRTAYIDGNLVQLAAGAFRIIDDCSGVHFFIVGQILAIVAAHVYLRTMIGKVALLAGTAVLTLVSNWLRVFIIIMSGDLTDMQHFLVTVDHYYFGWFLFVCLMIPFLLIVRRVGDAEFARLQRSSLETRLQTLTGQVLGFGLGTRLARIGPLLLAIALFAGPAYAYYLDAKVIDHPAHLNSLPRSIGSWIARDDVNALSSFKPQFPGAADEKSGVFQSGDMVVSIYLNRYERQTQGAELIGYGNKPFADYQVVSRANAPVAGLSIESAQFELSGHGDRLVVLRSFVIGSAATASEKKAKLLTGIYPMFGDSASGVVIVASPCDLDCADAVFAAQDFMSQVWTYIIGQWDERPDSGDED